MGNIEWEELTIAQKKAVKLISEKSLLGFQRCFFNITTGEKWKVNWHHKYIARIVEEIIDGKRKSTIFNVPPGAGKTEILSIHAPVYSILKTKKVRNLNVSFSNTLVQRNSMRAKDIIKSEEFQELWPMSFGKDKADEWQVINSKGKVKAEIVSRSSSGQITGGRGGYIGDGFSGWVCIDDIDKPEDMFSDVKRTKTHSILVNTLRSRRASKSKENPTPFVCIQQRLHVDDSTAFLTDPARGIGINFDVIKVPALIDEDYINSLPDWIREECREQVCSSEQINGKWSYWPENEHIGDLMELWAKSEYTFMSQYMQDPITLGGSVFSADWFRFYDPTGNSESYEPLPARLDYRFITADTAQKTKEHNDFSVICEWAKAGDAIYLLDMIRGKWEAPELRAMLSNKINESFSKNGGNIGNLRKVLIEDKSSGTGLIQELQRTSLPLPITPVQRNTDKLTRALDTAPQVQMGKVHIPAGAIWITDFVSEHSLFTPNDSHKHDDIVDNTCDAVHEAFLNGTSEVTNLMFKQRGR